MQTHARALAEDLQTRGHELLVLSYQSVTDADREACDRIDSEFPFPVERCLSRLGYFRNLDLIVEHADGFLPDLTYSSTVFYGGVGEEKNIPVVCRSPGNDILRPWIAWPFRTLATLFSQPWFESGCYKIFKKLDYPKILERLYYQRRRDLVRAAAGKAHLIYANSKFSASYLEEAGVQPSRISVLVGGVDSERFIGQSGGNSTSRFVIMTACRLVHKKGVDFLIRTMPRVLEQIPDAQLLIVGDGPKRKKYEKLIRVMDLSGCVTITGAIPQEEIQETMKSAQVFVLASRLVFDQKTGNCDAETMGRVLCEANACGVPVIAARSGGIPSVVADQENGLLFESDDEESYLAALGTIRNDGVLCRKMITEGIRQAREKFDWSVITATHEQDFRKACGRSVSEREKPPSEKLQNV